MKNIKKGKIIYGGMVRGRRNFLLINLVFTAIVIAYIVSSVPYIKARFHGPYDINTQHFIANTETITIDSEIVMKKWEDKSISSYAFMETSYCEGDKYRFNTTFDSIEDLDIKYTNTYKDPATGEEETIVVLSVYLGRIGDRSVLLISKGDDVPEANTPVKGVFNTHSRTILSEVSKKVAEKGPYTVSEYVYDTRNIEVDAENFNVTVSFVGLLLLIFLYARLIRYYINPYLHPAYKQIDKYGNIEDTIDSIEEQFAGEVERRENAYYTTDWIMTRELFRNKIVINHCTRGRYS